MSWKYDFSCSKLNPKIKTTQYNYGHEQSPGYPQKKQNICRLNQRWFALPPTSGWQIVVLTNQSFFIALCGNCFHLASLNESQLFVNDMRPNKLSCKLSEQFFKIQTCQLSFYSSITIRCPLCNMCYRFDFLFLNAKDIDRPSIQSNAYLPFLLCLRQINKKYFALIISFVYNTDGISFLYAITYFLQFHFFAVYYFFMNFSSQFPLFFSIKQMEHNYKFQFEFNLVQFQFNLFVFDFDLPNFEFFIVIDRITL